MLTSILQHVPQKAKRTARLSTPLTLALGLGLLAGCAAAPPSGRPSGCLVFGGIHLDSDLPRVDTLVLRIVSGPWLGRYVSLPVRNGVFYHASLGPGSYQFYRLAGRHGLHLGSEYFTVLGLGASYFEFQFTGQAGGFRLGPGKRVLYVGSYNVEGGPSVRSGDFSLEPDGGTERQALGRLLPMLKGTMYRAEAEDELHKLGREP